MSTWLQTHHQNRCVGKKRFGKPEAADRAAERASRKTGDLIISYKCIDCGRWHIGHADPAQRAARNLPPAPQKVFCVVCGERIPPGRIARAQRHHEIVDTCSKRCAQQQKDLLASSEGPVS